MGDDKVVEYRRSCVRDNKKETQSEERKAAGVEQRERGERGEQGEQREQREQGESEGRGKEAGKEEAGTTARGKRKEAAEVKVEKEEVKTEKEERIAEECGITEAGEDRVVYRAAAKKE